MKAVLLYTTFSNVQDAQKATDPLVTEGLAACVNIVNGMESSYMWQGKLERAQEVIAIIKTSSKTEAKAYERLAELHPYEVPCILSISVENGHVPYIAWLLEQCGGDK